MHLPIHQPKAHTTKTTTTTTTIIIIIIIIIIIEMFYSDGEGLGGWSPTALWRSGFDPRPVYAR